LDLIKGAFNSRPARAALLVVLMAGVAGWTVSTRSYREYVMGKTALEAGAYLPAITHFERSSLWYTPFGKYYGRSMAELQTLADRLKNEEPLFSRQASAALRRARGELYPFGGGAGVGGFPVTGRIMMHIAFFGWAALAVSIFYFGFLPDGRLRVRRASILIFANLIFLAAWLFLLSR